MFTSLVLGAIFLSGCSQPISDSQNNQTRPTEEWKEINHDNFWGNPNFFATPDYKFANIKFSHPSSWTFSCCNDRGGGSGHFFMNKEDKVVLSIFDYSLSGCPSNNKNCSIDETVRKTPEEKFNDIVGEIPKEILSKTLFLEKLGTNALFYSEKGDNEESIETYIIQTDKDVIRLSFIDQEKELIEKFIEKIEKD